MAESMDGDSIRTASRMEGNSRSMSARSRRWHAHRWPWLPTGISLSLGRAAFRPTTPPSLQRTPDAGGTTAASCSMPHFPSASSTIWACPDSPRNLNPPNRRMRTRMSGGVGGVDRANPGRPYPENGSPDRRRSGLRRRRAGFQKSFRTR